MQPKFWAILKYDDVFTEVLDTDNTSQVITHVKEFTERVELNDWLVNLPTGNLKTVEIISGFSLTKRVVN